MLKGLYSVSSEPDTYTAVSVHEIGCYSIGMVQGLDWSWGWNGTEIYLVLSNFKKPVSYISIEKRYKKNPVFLIFYR